jgi:hypothetical protein
MQMLYNSDSYAVVLFDVAAAVAPDAAPVVADAPEPLSHGGYEIFLQGVMAESFKEGVEALIQTQPSEEEIDDYIERFTSLMQQPVILH